MSLIFYTFLYVELYCVMDVKDVSSFALFTAASIAFIIEAL